MTLASGHDSTYRPTFMSTISGPERATHYDEAVEWTLQPGCPEECIVSEDNCVTVYQPHSYLNPWSGTSYAESIGGSQVESPSIAGSRYISQAGESAYCSDEYCPYSEGSFSGDGFGSTVDTPRNSIYSSRPSYAIGTGDFASQRSSYSPYSRQIYFWNNEISSASRSSTENSIDVLCPAGQSLPCDGKCASTGLSVTSQHSSLPYYEDRRTISLSSGEPSLMSRPSEKSSVCPSAIGLPCLGKCADAIQESPSFSTTATCPAALGLPCKGKCAGIQEKVSITPSHRSSSATIYPKLTCICNDKELPSSISMDVSSGETCPAETGDICRGKCADHDPDRMTVLSSPQSFSSVLSSPGRTDDDCYVRGVCCQCDLARTSSVIRRSVAVGSEAQQYPFDDELPFYQDSIAESAVIGRSGISSGRPSKSLRFSSYDQETLANVTSKLNQLLRSISEKGDFSSRRSSWRPSVDQQQTLALTASTIKKNLESVSEESDTDGLFSIDEPQTLSEMATTVNEILKSVSEDGDADNSRRSTRLSVEQHEALSSIASALNDIMKSTSDDNIGNSIYSSRRSTQVSTMSSPRSTMRSTAFSNLAKASSVENVDDCECPSNRNARQSIESPRSTIRSIGFSEVLKSTSEDNFTDCECPSRRRNSENSRATAFKSTSEDNVSECDCPSRRPTRQTAISIAPTTRSSSFRSTSEENFTECECPSTRTNRPSIAPSRTSIRSTFKSTSEDNVAECDCPSRQPARQSTESSRPTIQSIGSMENIDECECPSRNSRPTALSIRSTMRPSTVSEVSRMMSNETLNDCECPSQKSNRQTTVSIRSTIRPSTASGISRIASDENVNDCECPDKQGRRSTISRRSTLSSFNRISSSPVRMSSERRSSAPRFSSSTMKNFKGLSGVGSNISAPFGSTVSYPFGTVINTPFGSNVGSSFGGSNLGSNVGSHFGSSISSPYASNYGSSFGIPAGSFGGSMGGSYGGPLGSSIGGSYGGSGMGGSGMGGSGMGGSMFPSGMGGSNFFGSTVSGRRSARNTRIPTVRFASDFPNFGSGMGTRISSFSRRQPKSYLSHTYLDCPTEPQCIEDAGPCEECPEDNCLVEEQCIEDEGPCEECPIEPSCPVEEECLSFGGPCNTRRSRVSSFMVDDPRCQVEEQCIEDRGPCEECPEDDCPVEEQCIEEEGPCEECPIESNLNCSVEEQCIEDEGPCEECPIVSSDPDCLVEEQCIIDEGPCEECPVDSACQVEEQCIEDEGPCEECPIPEDFTVSDPSCPVEEQCIEDEGPCEECPEDSACPVEEECLDFGGPCNARRDSGSMRMSRLSELQQPQQQLPCICDKFPPCICNVPVTCRPTPCPVPPCSPCSPPPCSPPPCSPCSRPPCTPSPCTPPPCTPPPCPPCICEPVPSIPRYTQLLSTAPSFSQSPACTCESVIGRDLRRSSMISERRSSILPSVMPSSMYTLPSIGGSMVSRPGSIRSTVAGSADFSAFGSAMSRASRSSVASSRRGSSRMSRASRSPVGSRISRSTFRDTLDFPMSIRGSSTPGSVSTLRESQRQSLSSRGSQTQSSFAPWLSTQRSRSSSRRSPHTSISPHASRATQFSMRPMSAASPSRVSGTISESIAPSMISRGSSLSSDVIGRSRSSAASRRSSRGSSRSPVSSFRGSSVGRRSSVNPIDFSIADSPRASVRSSRGSQSIVVPSGSRKSIPRITIDPGSTTTLASPRDTISSIPPDSARSSRRSSSLLTQRGTLVSLPGSPRETFKDIKRIPLPSQINSEFGSQVGSQRFSLPSPRVSTRSSRGSIPKSPRSSQVSGGPASQVSSPRASQGSALPSFFYGSQTPNSIGASLGGSMARESQRSSKGSQRASRSPVGSSSSGYRISQRSTRGSQSPLPSRSTVRSSRHSSPRASSRSGRRSTLQGSMTSEYQPQLDSAIFSGEGEAPLSRGSSVSRGGTLSTVRGSLDSEYSPFSVAENEMRKSSRKTRASQASYGKPSIMSRGRSSMKSIGSMSRRSTQTPFSEDSPFSITDGDMGSMMSTGRSSWLARDSSKSRSSSLHPSLGSVQRSSSVPVRAATQAERQAISILAAAINSSESSQGQSFSSRCSYPYQGTCVVCPPVACCQGQAQSGMSSFSPTMSSWMSDDYGCQCPSGSKSPWNSSMKAHSAFQAAEAATAWASRPTSAGSASMAFGNSWDGSQFYGGSQFYPRADSCHCCRCHCHCRFWRHCNNMGDRVLITQTKGHYKKLSSRTSDLVGGSDTSYRRIVLEFQPGRRRSFSAGYKSHKNHSRSSGFCFCPPCWGCCYCRSNNKKKFRNHSVNGNFKNLWKGRRSLDTTETSMASVDTDSSLMSSMKSSHMRNSSSWQWE